MLHEKPKVSFLKEMDSAVCPESSNYYYYYYYYSNFVIKVKPSMAGSLPGENLLPQNVGSIINYFY